MSRIGKAPIVVGDKVQVEVKGQEVFVKGGKFTQSLKMKKNVSAKVDGKMVVLTRNDNSKESRALHGLYRALLQNAVTGVTQGFEKRLELVGVGYRASTAGRTLELSLGYSHPIKYELPEGIEAKVEKQTLVILTSPNKGLLGQVAAKIRGFRPPEPYLGKGVKYLDETIRRKAGKSAGK